MDFVIKFIIGWFVLSGIGITWLLWEAREALFYVDPRLVEGYDYNQPLQDVGETESDQTFCQSES